MLRIYYVFETSRWDMGISERILQWSQANPRGPEFLFRVLLSLAVVIHSMTSLPSLALLLPE